MLSVLSLKSSGYRTNFIVSISLENKLLFRLSISILIKQNFSSKANSHHCVFILQKNILTYRMIFRFMFSMRPFLVFRLGNLHCVKMVGFLIRTFLNRIRIIPMQDCLQFQVPKCFQRGFCSVWFFFFSPNIYCLHFYWDELLFLSQTHTFVQQQCQRIYESSQTESSPLCSVNRK